ncbi:hypothetical protein P171DRAFT_430520 [Karstenula rhodostoma CBS 690.94]|uniref:Uncharacterized protein n=1 Tax=Karstenula rhodostoma CBS 690.94 TaxID=1392251 RepID=A0A9P4UC54_9PLEO|nr:hypothetical protein P171DRAFT_430520 [Karstenula rhodostoma CBS 690.94]
MPSPKSTPPVQTRIPAPSSSKKSSGETSSKNTSDSKPSTMPRPDCLRIQFHPHPLKSINKTHIRYTNYSVMPGTDPVDTGLYLRASRSLFSRSVKAPITGYLPADAKRTTSSHWVLNTACFDELVDLYMKHGVAKGVVRNRGADGEKVKCTVVFVGMGEKVPKDMWKIKAWKEPVTWVRAKVMSFRGAYANAKEESVAREERKERDREAKRYAEEKARALECEDEDDEVEWDEKVVWE